MYFPILHSVSRFLMKDDCNVRVLPGSSIQQWIRKLPQIAHGIDAPVPAGIACEYDYKSDRDCHLLTILSEVPTTLESPR